MANPYPCYPHLWKKDSSIGLACYYTDDKGQKKKFSTPAELPAKKTDILCFMFAQDVGQDDVEVIKTFTDVKELQLRFYHSESWFISSSSIFTHFLNLPRKTVTSLTLTSAYYQLPSRDVLIFICSFPNLNYLRVGEGVCDINSLDVQAVETSSILDKPKLTGTFVHESVLNFTSILSQPQTVFGFEEIVQRLPPVSPFEGVKNLVEACFDTIKCIRINGCCKSSSDPCEIGPVSDQVLICSSST